MANLFLRVHTCLGLQSRILPDMDSLGQSHYCYSLLRMKVEEKLGFWLVNHMLKTLTDATDKPGTF